MLTCKESVRKASCTWSASCKTVKRNKSAAKGRINSQGKFTQNDSEPQEVLEHRELKLKPLLKSKVKQKQNKNNSNKQTKNS